MIVRFFHSLVGSSVPRRVVWAGASGTAWACSATAQVATNAPVRPIELQDIKGPLVIGSPWAWVGPVILILALAAAVALAWWWWRRTHPPESVAAAGLTPAERAWNRLQAALDLIEEPERFVTEVSETARTYLEERFGLRAPERTTEEFLNELSGSVVLDSRHKHLLSDFLTRCDLVKFARAEADRSELQELHSAAQRLVDETTSTGPGSKPEAAAPPPVAHT